MVLVLKVDPHIILGVALKEVNLGTGDLTLLIGLAQFNYSCLKPSPYRMVDVKSVVEMDGLGGFPLFQNPSRMDTDKLIILRMPASIMDEEVVVLDTKNFRIKPEVDFIEGIDILAYEKGLGGVFDLHWVVGNKV